jgi:hypothetical protein
MIMITLLIVYLMKAPLLNFSIIAGGSMMTVEEGLYG